MAPPSRSRVSGPSSGQNRGGPTPLPTYQPLQHPLTDSAQRALEKLPRDHRLDSLKEKLRVANTHLTGAAADINDRLHIQNEQYSKQKKRLEKQQGSQESTGELDARMAEAQDQTDAMTARLEAGVRKVIDIGADVESMERALKELQEKVSEGGGRVLPTQSTLGASYNRPARRGGRRGNDSDDGSEDDDSAQGIGDGESTTIVLKRKLADQQSAYQAMSMAERYALYFYEVCLLLTFNTQLRIPQRLHRLQEDRARRPTSFRLRPTYAPRLDLVSLGLPIRSHRLQ